MKNKFLFLVSVVAICIAFAACPPAAKKPPVKKPKAKQGEVKKEVPPPPPQAATPQRKASDRLVEKGIAALDSKNYDQASQLFQDAVNVDVSNGVAYYYLAMTDHYLGQNAAANGLLDKAESLLRYDNGWMDKIEDLRTKISGEKAPVAPLPPIVDQY